MMATTVIPEMIFKSTYRPPKVRFLIDWNRIRIEFNVNTMTNNRLTPLLAIFKLFDPRKLFKMIKLHFSWLFLVIFNRNPFPFKSIWTRSVLPIRLHQSEIDSANLVPSRSEIWNRRKLIWSERGYNWKYNFRYSVLPSQSKSFNSSWDTFSGTFAD